MGHGQSLRVIICVLPHVLAGPPAAWTIDGPDRICIVADSVLGFLGSVYVRGACRGERLAIFFAISGAGIAMIYPTVMAFIARRYPNGSDTAITFTVTLMGVGSVIGNYVIGWVIEGVKNMYGATTQLGLLRGLQAGYGFIGLCAVICAVSGVVLYVYLKRKQELI